MESLQSHWIHKVPLVKWSTRLLPIMRDPGSIPSGVLDTVSERRITERRIIERRIIERRIIERQIIERQIIECRITERRKLSNVEYYRTGRKLQNVENIAEHREYYRTKFKGIGPSKN